MVRLLIVAALALAAVGAALVLQRRRPRADLGPPQWHVPDVLDRHDFDRPDAPWLVVEFSSATCEACAAVWERVRPLESVEVAVQKVEARTGRDLHLRYQIDAVPLVVVADGTGAVRAHLLGPTTAARAVGHAGGASPRPRTRRPSGRRTRRRRRDPDRLAPAPRGPQPALGDRLVAAGWPARSSATSIRR